MKKQILAISSGLVFGALMLAGNVLAGEITYAPVNPNFGGNPFNASPLQTNASAQNGFTDPNALAGFSGLGGATTQDDRVNELVQTALATSSLNILVDDKGFFIVGRTLTTGNTTYSVTAGVGVNFVTATNNATGAITVTSVAAP